MSDITDAELREIINSIWMPILNQCVSYRTPDAGPGLDSLTASVGITGAWQGSISVRLSRLALNKAAAEMFTLDLNEITENDRIDTLLELTNMLGGTIKTLLPKPSDLTLPSIQNEMNQDTPLEQSWRGFTYHAEPLAIAITAHVCGDYRVA